jgi:hypothetical protein
MEIELIDIINLKAKELREKKQKIDFDWKLKESAGDANYQVKIDREDREIHKELLEEVEVEKKELVNMVNTLLLKYNIKNI